MRIDSFLQAQKIEVLSTISLILNPQPKPTCPEKKKKNPKLKPTKSSEVCCVKSPALKRLLPYHDEANPQPQKKRVTIPNETLFPDVLPAAAEPQPRHGQ